MNDFDKLSGRPRLGSISTKFWVNHMLPNMTLNHLGDKAVQGSPARGGLLQHPRALITCFDRSVNRFDLTAQAFDAI